MAKIDYEFDNEPLPPEPGAWGRRLRLIVIFIVIAAITAGLIYWLMPNEETMPSVNPPVPVENGQTPEIDTLTGNSSESGKPEDKTTAPPPVDENTATELPGDPVIPPGDGRGEGEGEDPGAKVDIVPDGGAAVTIPEENWTNPTREPEKGKPWIGDPKEDGPVKVENPQPVDLSSQLAEGRELLKNRKYEAALQAAEKALATPGLAENSPEWRQAAKLLTEANLALLRSGLRREKFAVDYTVKSGDNFSRLAAKFDTTIDAIKISSRMPLANNILPLGKRLVIYPGPWKIKVEKSARLLKLYNEFPAGGRLYAVFDIGIGRLGRTPSADFVISTKLKNPDWYTPEGRVIKYGDPENMLGDYFLKLAPTGTPDKPLLGYGIHGTRDDASVTKSQSNGCIRMHNADVQTLYRIVPSRTPVEIVD